ncbi:alpha/beta hydrolase [Intrasporangium sp.]|uniref:alpha/beta fold hydrolase n=1 Tax=Intrasporangium sp. TaxID=1925024 RepID=UPI0029395837|nr:alpha/beta hydrolase [Intrasporangium sp.]MDV3220867.1 alpha/beta hydrolase [Intrasporangium sp.]
MTTSFPAAERRTALGAHRVRSLHHGAQAAEGPHDPGLVVLLPGLGLPGYTLPTAAAIASRGVECAVLDVPGYGSSEPRSSRPTIDAIGSVAAQWILQEAANRPVVVLGHSTGAQAALTSALGLQTHRRRLALVLAGPTFRPEHRRVLRLIAATPFAYRDDRLAEIDIMEVLRARSDLVRLVASGLRDVPEDRVAGLFAPLSVMAGEHDSYAPPGWLSLLAASAVGSAVVRTSIIGGSHNNLYTHPDEVADVALIALEDAVAWP